MSLPTIAMAADHGGFQLKATLRSMLEEAGYKITDLGTHSELSVDYPDLGHALAKHIQAGNSTFGIAICGSGIGISIAANRHKGIRAALCHNATTARLSREHNDANILALGARVIGEEVAKDCVMAFLNARFAGDRHNRRIEKIDTPQQS